MNVVFWIIMICLLLVFILTLFRSVDVKKTSGERMTDLKISLMCFGLMLVMSILWR